MRDRGRGCSRRYAADAPSAFRRLAGWLDAGYSSRAGTVFESLATLYNRTTGGLTLRCCYHIHFTVDTMGGDFRAQRSRPGTCRWFPSAHPSRMIYERESNSPHWPSICNCLFSLIDCDLSWFPTESIPPWLAVIIQRQASIYYVMALWPRALCPRRAQSVSTSRFARSCVSEVCSC